MNLSRPDLIRDIHLTYLRAGSDAIETNTFGGSPITLGEFGLADRAHEINKAAVELALGLCGVRLEVAGARVTLGDAKTRPLAPYATLYAHRVAAERDDEESFVRQATEALHGIDVAADFIVGKRSLTRGAAGDIAGFSLMLAELSARQSLALQVHGLGAHRGLGFGVFVGHK